MAEDDAERVLELVGDHGDHFGTVSTKPLKSQGLVSTNSTPNEIFGGVDSAGTYYPPISSVDSAALDDCLRGGHQYVSIELSQVSAMPTVAETEQAMNTQLESARADAADNTVMISPVPASENDSSVETPDPVAEDGFVYARAAANCDYPRARRFLGVMNFYDDILLFPNFKTASGNEPFCYLNWDDDSCSIGPDSGPNFDFKYACKRHDFGWRNLKRVEARYDFDAFRQRNKNVSDERFIRDMVSDCIPRGAVSEFICKAVAQNYYQIVGAISPNTLGYGSPLTYVR